MSSGRGRLNGSMPWTTNCVNIFKPWTVDWFDDHSGRGRLIGLILICGPFLFQIFAFSLALARVVEHDFQMYLCHLAMCIYIFWTHVFFSLFFVIAFDLRDICLVQSGRSKKMKPQFF